MQGFWLSCLSRFEKELPAQQFNTWIRPLKVDANGGPSGELRLLAPNRFVLQWVKERFLPRIEAMGAEFYSSPIRVALVLDAAPAPAPEPAKPAAPARAGKAPRPANVERSSLIPEFDFENFVTGKANQLARAAALQVAEHPGTSYNPLFIYGGVGLGKTHLIHAVGNMVLAQQPNARVRYLHAAQYISDVVRAYQQKSFDEFKRYYHSLDLLLIDDIQFFTGKDRTQEEFFYAFNALIESHKQLIITCDTYPKDLAGIDERLKSRFSWGLTVAIEPPEQEMRVAIILKKAEAISLKLSEEVAFFIAKHIRSNVRELEGALKSVIAYSRFNGRDITLDTVKEALKDLLSSQNRQITIDNIQKTVAEYYKIKLSDMHSKKRSRSVARPRQLAMALAKDLTQMSLPDIGDAFGNRDHTTVLHACRTIASLREKNHDINRDYHILEQVLKG
ncbi:MAG TPA: chromosomal replication initiator protein DnaA [Burkholderiales bacterium]|jgi:chromosomal replication initiator protein|nr:chromosomal replication initiator protein DnaA [Burkholderiales bacterium]